MRGHVRLVAQLANALGKVPLCYNNLQKLGPFSSSVESASDRVSRVRAQSGQTYACQRDLSAV